MYEAQTCTSFCSNTDKWTGQWCCETTPKDELPDSRGSLATVTGPGKTGLIYTKKTCSNYDTYLLFCIHYPKSVSFIKFLMDFCIYDDIVDTILITDKKLLHFKLSKSSKILCVDKTGFPSQATKDIPSRAIEQGNQEVQ